VSHAIEKPTDITIPAGSLWAKLPMLGGAAAVVGLGATLAMAFGEHKARAMFSYLWAFEVMLCIAQGALGFVLIQHAVRAGWSTVIRRIAETASMTLPIFVVLLIPIVTLGMHELYPWSHHTDEILEKKRWFLSTPFFLGRAALYLAIWCFLSWFMYSNSVKQDSATDAGEIKKLTHKMWFIAAPGLALYALSQSFAAIDWLMSLQPHWYSTIFGVYIFAASILAFFCFVTLVSMGLQNAGVLKQAITVEHFHDMGKFVYGFTVFWTYIAFSQFILIWYANIPEETEFYLVRLEGGWNWVSYALPVAHFFVPFLFMLSRHIKRNRMALAAACGWMLFMHLVDLYWLVLPNYGTHGEGEHHAHLAVSWLDFAALIGMAGAFFAAFGYFLNKNKVVCINDPRLEESLAHENF